MKKQLLEKLYGFTFLLEFCISFLLAIDLILYGVNLFFEIIQNPLITSSSTLNGIIEETMTIAIGVELIKMLCKHTISTVIEVLLFAIARQIIIAHASIIDSFIGVVCIAILFGIRKFLFTSNEEMD